jgi:hypothetical protein
MANKKDITTLKNKNKKVDASMRLHASMRHQA